MFSSGLAHHCLLITDYPGQPPAPPAPPAPAPTPAPPPAIPLAFSVVTRASVFGIVGSALGTITLATVTCSDSSATIRQSITVPGLTFSYASNVLTVAGTPTGNAAKYRVVVSYIASSDGATVLGSSEHEVTIANAAQTLTIGTMTGAVGRVGQVMAQQALCSPTSNFAVDVIASVSGFAPNAPLGTASPATQFSWARGASSGSGTLTTRAITPSESGTYTLSVVYSGNGQTLGTSTHQVVIAPSYQAPAPAPAPAAGPAAPAPSPPPAPTPAPAPGHSADPYLSSTKVLMHFDDNPGLSVDQDLTLDERGNTFTNYGATQGTGAVGTAAALTGTNRITGAVSGADGLDYLLTAECMVDISATAWAALTAAGNDFRYCPVLTYETAAGEVVWSLGIFSYTYLINTVRVRETRATFFVRAPLVYASGYDQLHVFPFGALITDRPNRFVHLCGAMKPPAGATRGLAGAWLDGLPSIQTTSFSGPNRAQQVGTTLQIGGACQAIPAYYGGDAVIVPFDGSVDEVRVTTVCRPTASLTTSTTYSIAPASRVIPWPNY